MMSIQSATYRLETITGKHDVKELKREIDTLPGVRSVSVNPQTNHVAVDFDATGVTHQEIAEKIKGLGFYVTELSCEAR